MNLLLYNFIKSIYGVTLESVINDFFENCFTENGDLLSEDKLKVNKNSIYRQLQADNFQYPNCRVLSELNNENCPFRMKFLYNAYFHILLVRYFEEYNANLFLRLDGWSRSGKANLSDQEIASFSARIVKKA